MNPGLSPATARASRVASALAVSCLALFGCAKRTTQVDAGYTTPEGVPTADARMLVWRAATTTMPVYQDVIPLGPSTNDPVIGQQTIVGDPVGSIHGMVFDRTPAGQFEVLRREPGGGLRVYDDYPRRPTRKWLASTWEIYRFDDASPSGFTPPSYVGRGLIDGRVAAASPISNEATLASASLGNINVSVTNNAVANVDTVGVINWDVVPGATDYVIQVYEFRAASVSQQMVSGLPMPINDRQSRDHLVLWVRWGAGSVARYQIGDTARTDVDLIFQRPLLPQPDPSISNVVVRVSAFDASGRLIAYSLAPAGAPPGGDPPFPRNFGIAPVSDTEYGAFPLGGLQVERLRFPRPR